MLEVFAHIIKYMGSAHAAREAVFRPAASAGTPCLYVT